MNVMEAIQTRRSVRAYADRPVPEDVLRRILAAARLAPSGNNRQPWRFVVVTEPDRRADLAAAARNQGFVAEAPVVIAGVGLTPDRSMSCGVPGDPVDVAIALDHLSLAAVAEGLGTCWIGAFDQDRVRALLGVPETAKVIELMTLGYPADRPREKPRHPFETVVCRERFAGFETAGGRC